MASTTVDYNIHATWHMAHGTCSMQYAIYHVNCTQHGYIFNLLGQSCTL